ncbi:OmpA/MotB family protein [Actinomadura litoris]|uniref:OmpA/MotB family protein n=1 Tax=Actinomadura litoris TaxID=2678616 RepID=UPI001FA6EE2F|nr:OmpA family protein [Actinomadura litoris]
MADEADGAGMAGMADQAALPLAARELALAQARTLARHGRYAEAEAILTDAGRDADPSVPLLDLLARVHAQQGRLDEADAAWDEAEHLAPGSPEIAECRRRVAKARARRSARPAWPYAAAVPVAALAVAVLVVAGTGEEGDGPAPVVVRTVPAAPAPARPSPAPDVLAGMDLGVPGAVARRRQGEISVSFRQGLFQDGVRLSRDGRAALSALGARLRPYATRISVAVIGHTDDRPVPPGRGYATNTELGTLRAMVVRELLHDRAGIPTGRFTVSSLGAASALEGDRSPARNRTVGLRISPAGQE